MWPTSTLASKTRSRLRPRGGSGHDIGLGVLSSAFWPRFNITAWSQHLRKSAVHSMHVLSVIKNCLFGTVPNTKQQSLKNFGPRFLPSLRFVIRHNLKSNPTVESLYSNRIFLVVMCQIESSWFNRDFYRVTIWICPTAQCSPVQSSNSGRGS